MKLNAMVIFGLVFCVILYFCTNSNSTARASGAAYYDIVLPYSGVTNYDGFAFGITNQAHGNCTGIIGSSWGENGKGIHGIVISNKVDAINYGGYFESAGGNGIAVFGQASYSDSVKNYGGYFVAKGKEGIGVYGHASGLHGKGVMGKNPSGYTGYLGTDRYAVESQGPLLVHGAGIRVENATGYPIMTIDGPSGWNTDFWGKVVVRSRPSGNVILELGEGLDYAEGFNVTNRTKISPGSVLIIDSENPGKLKLSENAYDKKVAGIVCGANSNKSGVRLGVDKFELSIALAGRLYCNVDATYGKVVPGDLLTTSPTPGYAMVVKDSFKAQGSILGKAMESMEKGKKGQILVFVTLQ